MTRRKMLLLIIGSLITVSTAVGVGVKFATANGSLQESSSLIQGIDTSSPITKDSEETDVIDKEKDKSPSSPPAKVEINDKRKVSQTQTKDKQEPVKQTTPPTNSPVVVRKEGATSDTNNKGTQLIIGDVSKLNLPQKENKEESKDSQSKPAVVIINDTPTPPQTKKVEKNEEQSNPDEQKSTGAPVVVEDQPQPQQTSPQEKQEENAIANKSNEQQTQGESSQQGSEIHVEAPNEKQTEEPISPESQPSQPNDIDDSESNPTSPTQIELTNNNEQEQNQENSIDTEPTFTESQITVLNAINDFKKVQSSYDLDKFIENHTIRPDQADLFFANIPKDWIRNDQKQNWLRRFWRENIYKVSNDEAQRAIGTPAYRQGKQYTESPDNWFNRELGLRESGELNGQIISGADSFLVKGVPPKLKQKNDDTP